MSAATASVADVSRTDNSNRDDRRDRNKSGQSQAQCTPMPLPALGTQKIIQGNGTNVGTVIALQCPDKHRVVGREVKCVMDTNSTHWVGEIYCKPLAPFEDYGFRVAVLASIISSAIIFLMSMAFITCCLLDCIKEEDKRKKEERDVRQWEEQAPYHEDSRSRYSHKGRNNNNNNTQEKVFSPWDTANPAMCDNRRACRCHQQYAYGPARTYGPALPLSALPGSPRDCDQPLLPRNPESVQISAQYFGPPQSSCQSTSPGLVQISAAAAAAAAAGSGVVWEYAGHQSSSPGVNPSTTDESNTGNLNPAKEFSIRIISV